MGNKNYDGISQQTRLRVAQKTNKSMEKVIELAKTIGLNQKRVLQIVSMNVWQLIDKLNSNQITSVQIVLSVIMRTSKVGKDLNLYTETNFQYAIDAAAKCDEVRKTTKKMNWTFKNQKFQSSKYLPPLFGIPISIKDTYDMQGFTSSIGIINRLNTKFEQSPLIASFKDNGMIPYVRTNIPQIGMTFQSVNNIWGRSLNPWNRDRAVGGSSGGQGGLISSRCSILGIGSDIGGSIRIPAEFCGIVGLKPYSKRFSATYHTKFSDAFTGSAGGIPLCIGPLAKSVQDLAYFMKATTNESFYAKNSDPYIKNIQFDQKAYIAYSNQKDKLKIGFIKSLTDIQPTKASQRALKQVIDKLKGMGHDCVEIQIPNEKQIIRQFLRQNLGAGGQLFRQLLAGQQPIKQYTSLFQIAQMSTPIKGIAKCGSSELMPRLYYYFFQKGATMSSYQYQKHLGLIDSFKRQWIKYWRLNKLDFVICPGFGCQAVIHGNSQNTALAASYCFLWNLLDMCVGTIPITTVNPDQEVYETVHTDILADGLRKNAQNSRGLPVGVQVVGLPYQQQKVLGLMNLLEKNILFYKSHPLPKVE